MALRKAQPDMEHPHAAFLFLRETANEESVNFCPLGILMSALDGSVDV